MGYEIVETETLELPDFPGVEVVVKLATSFAEFAQIQRLGMLGGDVAEADKMDAALADFGARFIDSWNITSKGVEVPPSEIHRIPLPLQIAIVSKWMSAIRGPAAPLGQESSNGLDSPEDETTEPANS